MQNGESFQPYDLERVASTRGRQLFEGLALAVIGALYYKYSTDIDAVEWPNFFIFGIAEVAAMVRIGQATVGVATDLIDYFPD